MEMLTMKVPSQTRKKKKEKKKEKKKKQLARSGDNGDEKGAG